MNLKALKSETKLAAQREEKFIIVIRIINAPKGYGTIREEYKFLFNLSSSYELHFVPTPDCANHFPC